jgi:hypothetical protein
MATPHKVFVPSVGTRFGNIVQDELREAVRELYPHKTQAAVTRMVNHLYETMTVNDAAAVYRDSSRA